VSRSRFDAPILPEDFDPTFDWTFATILRIFVSRRWLLSLIPMFSQTQFSAPPPLFFNYIRDIL
ncbi:MAG TPA: hypothetical protein VKX17_09240, partial [Planctomycetota bacterium]|nr:hypothetical protein [Planctomycetota bacterium]